MTRTYIIAEIGINHNGSLDLAKQMILSAKICGVDAVKFQTFKASEFISDKSQMYSYTSQGETITEPQIDMFERVEFSIEDWKELFKYCDEIGIESFTTPQNPTDLDLILSITSVPKIKVGSDDLTNLPLMQYYASKGLPMIISTGMSYEEEINDAITVIKESGCKDLTVLHCVSLYPTPLHKVNMNKMLTIKNKFGVKIGFSDHTLGTDACFTATLLGATVLEKHFTLDKNLPGPDHWFSANPIELKKLVDDVRKAESILGKSELVPLEDEMPMRDIARRSITTIKDIKIGEIFTIDNIGLRRPGNGISSKDLKNIINKKSKINIKANTTLNLENHVKNI